MPAPAPVPGRASAGSRGRQSRGRSSRTRVEAAAQRRRPFEDRAHCSPVRRPRLPHRHCAHGWRGSQGRREDDGGRWVTQDRRGKTGYMCAGCSGQSSPTSRSAPIGRAGLVVSAGPGTTSPCRIRTRATAFAETGLHVPGINRRRVARRTRDGHERPVHTEHRLPGTHHWHDLTGHQDVLPPYGLCGESTDTEDSCWPQCAAPACFVTLFAWPSVS